MSEYVCELPVDGMASFVSGTELIPVREEIVRCRDCMSFMEGATPHDEDYPHFCIMHGIDLPSPNGFCAWGCRKCTIPSAMNQEEVTEQWNRRAEQ